MQNPISGNWTSEQEAREACIEMNDHPLAAQAPVTFIVYQNMRSKQFGCYPRGLRMPKSYRAVTV